MSRRHQDKGRLGPFVALIKETMQSPAWRRNVARRSERACLLESAL